VHAVIRGQNNPKRGLVEAVAPEVVLHTGDLTDLSSLLRARDASQPDEVYNLGAVSFVAYSWENAHADDRGHRHWACSTCSRRSVCSRRRPAAVRFYQASSSEMFGKVQQVPQHERTLLWPRSPYGVAKVFGHYMTINYRESYGMHASSGILFNHESPRRGPEFVTRKISMAVAAIVEGRSDHVVMGNLDAERDWGFAGDYVEGDVADAPAADGRRLRPGNRGDPLDPRLPRRRLRPCGHRGLVGLRAPGPPLHATGRGRPARRGPGKAREVLGWTAEVSFPGAGRDDGRRDLAQLRAERK
jgi:GDPmannose 4,6-dehydratase